MSYEASSITLTMQWVTAGMGKGAFALTEQPGWVSEVMVPKSETSVIQGKADFLGKVGILTLCLPADHTDRVTHVTTCQLEPDLMRLSLSYVQGEEKGYIVIDNTRCNGRKNRNKNSEAGADAPTGELDSCFFFTHLAFLFSFYSGLIFA